MDLQPEHLQRRRTERAARIRQRMLWGLPIVSAMQVGVGLAGACFFPGDSRIWLLAVTLAVLANGVLFLVWWARARRARILAAALLPANPAAIGLVALRTGGFGSPWLLMILGLWLFWVAIAQIRTRNLAVVLALELGCLFLVLWAGGAEPSRDAIPVVSILAFVAVLSVTGAAARDRAERQLWQAMLTQEALQAALERQVAERGQRLDELAAQLQNRVRDRSAALARALDGLHARQVVPGTVIDGRVEIVRLLGRGGMGTVFLGRDRITGQTVAVKLMHPGLCDEGGIRRFLREAASVSAVTHPGIVRTNHVDVSEDGQLYQVMEYARGVTLQQRLAGGPYAIGPGCRVAAALADALGAAHRAGIVHRDIKPANVMLTTEVPGVRVLDFGISKLVGDTAGHVTETRQVLGTAAYMAPEQIRRSGEATAAADVYSLGVVLFEMLAGRLPFSGSGPTELFEAHLYARPPSLGALRDVPDPLARLVDECLHKEASARPDAPALHRRLTEIADAEGAPSADALNRADPHVESAPAVVDPLAATRQS